MDRIDWNRWACVLIVLSLGTGVLYVTSRFLLSLFLPFLLALFLAWMTRPIAKLLARKTGWPLRACAVITTVLAMAVLGVLFYLLALRLFSELQRLLDFLVEDSAREDGKIARVVAFFREIGGRLPLLSRLENIGFLQDILGDPSEYFVAQLQQLLGDLASKLTGGIAALISRLPGVLFFLVVTLIACFYFALE